MNTLANHGYMSVHPSLVSSEYLQIASKRNGKAIPWSELEKVVPQVYNIDASVIKAFHVGAIGTIASGLTTLSLGNLDKTHNTIVQQVFPNFPHWPTIERPGSLAHRDTKNGAKEASSVPDPAMLQPFYDLGKKLGGSFPFTSLGKIRSIAAERSQGVNDLVKHIAAGELYMTWHILKDSSGNIPLASFKSFLQQNKLPDGFHPPSDSMGLPDLVKGTNQVLAQETQTQTEKGTSGSSPSRPPSRSSSRSLL